MFFKNVLLNLYYYLEQNDQKVYLDAKINAEIENSSSDFNRG